MVGGAWSHLGHCFSGLPVASKTMLRGCDQRSPVLVAGDVVIRVGSCSVQSQASAASPSLAKAPALGRLYALFCVFHTWIWCQGKLRRSFAFSVAQQDDRKTLRRALDLFCHCAAAVSDLL